MANPSFSRHNFFLPYWVLWMHIQWTSETLRHLGNEKLFFCLVSLWQPSWDNMGNISFTLGNLYQSSSLGNMIYWTSPTTMKYGEQFISLYKLVIFVFNLWNKWVRHRPIFLKYWLNIWFKCQGTCETLNRSLSRSRHFWFETRLEGHKQRARVLWNA